MTIKASKLKEIRQDLDSLKPIKITLDGDKNLTIRESIFALAPTLEKMKKRGFSTQEIVHHLHEKGITIKPNTLACYMTAYRQKKNKKADRKATKNMTQPLPPTSSENQSIAHKNNSGFELIVDWTDDNFQILNDTGDT